MVKEKAFQNCSEMKFVEANWLQKCEIDAFLGCFCSLKTDFKGELVDVERVDKIDEKEFK